MGVNFNQKQWRQDFAYYVKEKLEWDTSRVTKSKVIEKGHYDNSLGDYISSLKEFRVINGCGEEVIIQYYFDCTVGEDGMEYTDRDFNLVYEYLQEIEKIPLWYLLSDFFYKHKCHNGAITRDKDFYSFVKNNNQYRVYRINDSNFTIEKETIKYFECIIVNKIENIPSIKEVEKKLEELIK